MNWRLFHCLWSGNCELLLVAAGKCHAAARCAYQPQGRRQKNQGARAAGSHLQSPWHRRMRIHWCCWLQCLDLGHVHTHTNVFIGSSFFSPLPNSCFKLLDNKHVLSPTDFRLTCIKRQFLPAVCVLLLCRQQPPDISDNNFAVVDFKDIATPTAGKSMGRQSQRENSNLLIITFSVDLD